MLVLVINVEASTTYIQGVVKTTSAIYSSPSATSSARLKTITGGAVSLYLPEAVEITGESGDFYQIKFIYSGYFMTGYIKKANITAKTYYTDDNYEAYLRNLGFPSDYASKLAILHAIHPNWSFTPSFTGGVSGGMDFYSAVNAEAEIVSRNLVDGTNTSLRSTEDAAYSNGVWKTFSGSKWYAASKQTIAFYMDPRNFLNESNIFMFENLGYNASTQTIDVVNKIIGSSFMSNPFYCYSGANICNEGSHYYANTFVEIGSEKKVSPVHLASRVIKEQGTNGSVLSLGNGYNGEYVGYYNFFNVGASGTTDYDVIMNGLKYAYNRNWNNQYASISGGATTIANGYVTIGQSTIYYQKFNTILQNYAHQYMQNVRAPYSEGYNTYEAYYKTYASQDEWNNATYDFLIPVYSNMGYATSLDASGNSDATLSSLTVSSCTMNPSFQSSAYNYECYVPKNVTGVTVNAIPTNSLAKTTAPSNYSLTSDNSSLSIVVTAAAGNTSTYTINIHRIDTDGYSPSDILNGVGVKVNGNIASNIAVGSDVSNLVNSIKNNYHFATVDVNNSGTIKTGTEVTIVNAGITSTFKVVLYGDSTGDGTIDIKDLLVIKKHLVNASKLSDVYLLSSDINRDGTVDIKDLLLEKKHLVGQYTITQG